MTSPESVCLEMRIRFKYHRPAGEVVGLFLATLRDDKKIIGSVCKECGTVSVPPASYCERCSGEVSELREVGPRGVVLSWTRPPDEPPGSPVEFPFRYVMVHLAGADSSLLHLAPDDERIRIGSVVKPVFREQRTGSITDIKWFVPAVSGKSVSSIINRFRSRE